MFVKRFFEPTLAQTSYLIGCPDAREAIVIDPNRDVDQYLREAEAEDVRITHVTETHIHADYVSGSRELAARAGATVYLSDEGGADWTYQFAGDSNVVRVKHGHQLAVGRVLVDVLHTPGHTPEHLTFLITDRAAANEPMAAATGDFIFVGDVGRPDLLERAAKVAGTMESSARALFRSLQAFRARPDWLQIWPGHGAGSACGKGISAIPQSTLGYEKRFNWAFQIDREDEFVRSVLAGQPEPPKYFAEMKRINKEGPRLLGGFNRPPRLDASLLPKLLQEGALVIDTRRAADFAVGHVPGTINIPLNTSFTTWAGWLVPYTADFYVLVDDRRPDALDVVVRDLAMIGLDRVAGYFDTVAVDALVVAGRPLGTIPQLGTTDLAASLEHNGIALIDVRNAAEWRTGHIAGARHIPLGYLADELDTLPRERTIVVQCQGGSRSAIGASLLRARGFDRVVNFTGGMAAWVSEGRKLEGS
ncbi:MAG TPA: rhodanese-like domain-containing protein [Vicinamibacterales bacterium]|nr:rhodanese-like domain-containing protein [Vicinamibacterales bacterium]